jgi:hypothetical protein
MGSSFSTTPTPQEQNLSLPLALVQYDTQKANAAIQHTNSDFVDPRFLANTLLPGDMIQKKGNFIPQWFYSHFAIFIGNGEIVHVTNNQMFGNCFIAREIMVDVHVQWRTCEKKQSLRQRIWFSHSTSPSYRENSSRSSLSPLGLRRLHQQLRAFCDVVSIRPVSEPSILGHLGLDGW